MNISGSGFRSKRCIMSEDPGRFAQNPNNNYISKSIYVTPNYSIFQTTDSTAVREATYSSIALRPDDSNSDRYGI
ncbi:hypothetical protein PL11201_730067 [Planktothrix sp. PCC 11201]|nr:hypothetical protein PL11201_730067 [Planktothrix sp. PCC 11201]